MLKLNCLIQCLTSSHLKYIVSYSHGLLEAATDWDKYADATDNGVKAILAVRNTTGDKTDTLAALASLVKVAVPFMKPPAGMVVGGALSLMSGIFGWENDGMAELSNQIEAGFAKINLQLASISRKLDDMAAAIDRIDTRTP